jgi:hypothetical protein
VPRLPIVISASAAMLAGAFAVAGGTGLGPAIAHAASTTLPTTPAPTPTVGPGGEVADFLTRELRAGGGLLDYPGTDQADLGVRADAILGVLAARSGRTQVAASTTAIEASADDYLGPTFGATELYAGPVAKLAILAAATDRDPRAFGGHDLIADLAALESVDGRFADRTAYTDSSNTFTQALGIIAQVRAGISPSAKSVNFLVAQQCSDGGLRMTPGAEPCVSDPEAASMAVTALSAAGSHAAESTAALDYLARRQGSDGGLGGGVGASAVNANSTGLAGMAFRLGDRREAWRAAQSYLMSVQFGCDAPDSLRGAIAYNAAAFDALTAAGSSAVATDQERRASAQAVLALGQDSLVDLTIETAAEPLSLCTTATTDPSSTTTDPSSTTAGSETTTPTTSVTATPSGTAQPTSTTSNTVTVPPPASTVAPPATDAPPAPTSTAQPSATKSSASGSTPTSTDSSSTQHTMTSTTATSTTATRPSATTEAATAAAGGAADDDSTTTALGAAGVLVLLGAGTATWILRRERKTT